MEWLRQVNDESLEHQSWLYTSLVAPQVFQDHPDLTDILVEYDGKRWVCSRPKGAPAKAGKVTISPA